MHGLKVIGAVGLALIPFAVIATSRWQVAEQPSDWRGRFTRAALEIPFDTERTPIADRDLPADVKQRLPDFGLTIAHARKRDTSRLGRVEARITSTSDSGYPRLGIAKGINYVWRDYVDGRTRLIMIPADTSRPAYWLMVSRHDHPALQNPPLLVMVRDSTVNPKPPEGTSPHALKATMADCIGPCELGPWCTSKDTIHRISRLSVPLSAIDRYFARNKVAWRER